VNIEADNKLLSDKKMFNVGVRLVKFAWAVEVLAVSIGFLISIIVSYSVYHELVKSDREFSFGDYSNILVAGLPFLLVAIVEGSKIPVATAMMYARHTSWRIILFFGVVLLSAITFETMLNGFERNFASLNISIDERKNESLLIQNQIDDIENRKKEIDIIDPDEVERLYNEKLDAASGSYNETLTKERKYVSHLIGKIKKDYVTDYESEIAELQKKERDIYEAWDNERVVLQNRLRKLLNENMSGVNTDKQKLQKELDELKAEMTQKLAESTFFTRTQIEEKYRNLIKEKEARLYKVSDYSSGASALQQQTETEKQLQNQLEVLGRNFQKRIDLVQTRIKKLNSDLEERLKEDDQVKKKYRQSYSSVSKRAARDKQSTIERITKEREDMFLEYEEIQLELKKMNQEIFELKKKQTIIAHDINRLVNSNQIYRLAAYIANAENAIDVPKNIVGLVALFWFASLAFICAVTGVFLAIVGIYIQKAYAEKAEDEIQKEHENQLVNA